MQTTSVFIRKDRDADALTSRSPMAPIRTATPRDCRQRYPRLPEAPGRHHAGQREPGKYIIVSAVSFRDSSLGHSSFEQRAAHHTLDGLRVAERRVTAASAHHLVAVPYVDRKLVLQLDGPGNRVRQNVADARHLRIPC